MVMLVIQKKEYIKSWDEPVRMSSRYTGGYKVSAVEVENEVLIYPAVQECAVIGIPHAEWGEQVCAVCVLKPGKKQFELADLRAFLKPNLATYKIPAQLKFVDELPRNGSMKINKKDLLTLFSTEQ
ncbi:hypothetical protein SeMB42_g00261 [Synchytrium endobioticum]|uniref:AMP-binding enzyme C-terminal domain-containing protein n=1 Tax=Synchytrium endobioticum TaxID=286115 RepID=A0A507DSD5_9FUNG|nr:hypothetical protein SeMB42_g00261 [Synchytrium endobioticum]